MNAKLNPERHTTVSFTVALATILVLGIFGAVIAIFLLEGVPAERVVISWVAEQEARQAANTAAMPRDLSSQPIKFHL